MRDGVIYTPELTSCLDGITRNTIFHLAAECGYTIKEKRITRDEVYIADEAFLPALRRRFYRFANWMGGLLVKANAGLLPHACRLCILMR